MGDAAESAAEAPFPLTDTDRWVLSQTDGEFKRNGWDDLVRIIGGRSSCQDMRLQFTDRMTETNDLEKLLRTPSELRRYMAWSASAKAEYGTISDFMLAHRLPKHWGRPPFSPASDVPMADASDYTVLINDWPYATEPGIVHIVVWTRTPIATKPGPGDMTDESRQLLGDFVQNYFSDVAGDGNVIWFKNWTALQSVRALEHFHVFVRGVDDATLQRWTEQTPARDAEGHHMSR